LYQGAGGVSDGVVYCFRVEVVYQCESGVHPSGTCLSLVPDEGSSGRQNFFMEPMAAGKAGAENSAATRLMRKIHDIISSSLLEGQVNGFKRFGPNYVLI